MSATMEIELLPRELLGKVFSHVWNSNSRNDNNGQESIKQCRLVSRHFNDVASPFLITEVAVDLTLESFSRLETICRHPIFGKSVRKVVIILSYYEAELASDKLFYIQEAHSRLLRHVEMHERASFYRRRYPMTDECYEWLSGLGWGPTDRLVIADNDDNPPTPIQKLFSRAYDLYKEKYDNQERLRQNNSHIGRLCAALCSLSNLVSLELEDPYTRLEKLDAVDFSDTGFNRDVLLHFDSIIRRSTWSGYHKTDHSATPPVEMLGLLCSQLGEHGLRPKAISLTLCPPPNMQV
ncbi:hypothetical protein F53441_6675 [Fusarium austroafricanum]|uniref:F-box domain-containing protein n=1 Tax=Fusarium austroafricanum TaxID=2364996 RepID=A0A8H4KFA6_9HYPO|nr:hypothetical protein F53441_6675 [Fusarium austroafricanum]